MDLASVVAASNAVSSTIRTIREVLAAIKDARSKKTPPEISLSDQDITQLENKLKTAEVEIAISLGYPICRCKFPPVIMKKIGHKLSEPERPSGRTEVFQCSACFNRVPNLDVLETLASPGTISVFVKRR